MLNTPDTRHQCPPSTPETRRGKTTERIEGGGLFTSAIAAYASHQGTTGHTAVDASSTPSPGPAIGSLGGPHDISSSSIMP